MTNLKEKIKSLPKTKDWINYISNMDRQRLVFTIFCAILFILTAYWTFNRGICYFNSDTASLSLYVREQIHERSFFPKGWLYGNELNFVTPHLLILPLSLLHIPAYICRQITDVIFMAILLVSVVYITRKIFNFNTSIITNIFLFSGISSTYVIFLYAQASYASIFFITFFAVGLFFESITESLNIQSKRKFILFLFMVAFTSLNGFLYFELFTIPLILALLTYVFFEDYFENPSSLLMFKNIKNIIFLMGLCMFVGYSGYTLLSKQFSLDNSVFTNIGYTHVEYILDNMAKFFKTFLSISGYQGGAMTSLLSLGGITCIIKLFMHLLFSILFPLLLAKRYYTLPYKIKLFLWYCAWNMLIIFIISVFTSFLSNVDNYDRYIIFQTVLLYMLGAYYVSVYCIEKKRKIVTMFSTCCIIIFCTLSVYQLYTVYGTKDAAKQQLENYHSLLSVLEENNLSFGYSTFWHSHTFSVMSNYDIEIAPITLSSTETQPFPYLSSSRVYEEDYYTGSTFLMMLETENSEYIGDRIPSGVTKTIRHNDYIIYVFDYNFNGKLMFY